MEQKEKFGKVEFEEVIGWMLPAFPLVKNEYSLPPITIACVSLIANAVKRQGEVLWNEPLKQKLERWNLIEGAETYDDMRLNLIIVGDAGSGKTGILKGMNNLNPFPVAFRQSQPNYDQLIGSTEKWMEGKQWKYQPFPGELSKDLVLMDEVLSIYTRDTPENTKIRELIRASLSRVGTNPVMKPMVRIPEQFQVNFYPECSIVQGFPAEKVPTSLVRQGDIRRGQVLTVSFPLQAKENTKRFGGENGGGGGSGKKEDAYSQARDYLKYLRSKHYEFYISDTTMEYLKSSMRNLKEFTNTYGAKASWFFGISYFDIESQLLRYAIIMAIVRDSNRLVVEITVEDVLKAWKYFSTAYANSLVWINNYTTGDFGGVGMSMKNDEFERVKLVVKWLEEEGAFTLQKSSISAIDVKNFLVAKRWFSTLPGSKRFYSMLIANGFIRSGRRGTSWFVWIGPTGMEVLADGEKYSPWGD